MKYIVTVRGKLQDPADGQAVHDSIIAKLKPMAKGLGNVGHHTFLNPQAPDDFFAVDEWESMEGIQRFNSDPQLQTELGKMFQGMPEVRVWSNSGWEEF